MKIPFNRPYLSGREGPAVEDALASMKHCGNGPYGRKCEAFITKHFAAKRVFLTPSATAALEMSTILAGVRAGDEVILPSYTFSSTANAFCLRGAVPVFVDIRPDTLVMDHEQIERRITPRTRAIVPINYGGISPDTDAILEIAGRHGLRVVEDAAQGIDALDRGRPVGSVAPLSVYSFHETKNISCGEGGALLVNDESLERLGEFAQEKGTDRSLVVAGLKSKYSWVSLGSSYLLPEMLSAMLLTQLEDREKIKASRRRVHERYVQVLSEFADRGIFRLQRIPPDCETNYHAFYLIFREPGRRDRFIADMARRGISCYIGYLALHTSEMGRRYGTQDTPLPVTDDVEKNLVRLPIYAGLSDGEIDFLGDNLREYFRGPA